MVKKSKRKAPSKAKSAKAPAKPVPVEVPPPRVSFRPTKPTTRKSSVIMLSSAENSLCSEPSLILNEPSISIIDLARPSTRMSNIEMDMTDLSDPRFSARSPGSGGDDTNLSLTNIVQTPGIYRERPKSSWVMRRTRSKSMAPAPAASQEDIPGDVGAERPSRSRATQSGEFSKVTRRARSVRPPARYLESIDENAVSKRAKGSRKNRIGEQEPRVVSESNQPMVTPAKVTTRKRKVVKDKIPEDIATEPEDTQSSSVSTRERNKRNLPDVNQNTSEKELEPVATSVSKSSLEEDADKSLETVSMVSVRRRRPIERPTSPEYPSKEPVFTPVEPEPEPVPAPVVRTRCSTERPPSPVYSQQEPAVEPVEPEQESSTVARRRGRPRLKEPAVESNEPAPVARPRGRPRRPPSPVYSRKEPAVEPIEPEPDSSPAPVVRTRTRSASRGRQPALSLVLESATRPKRVTKQSSKCPCCINGEPHQDEPTQPAPATRGRSRTRSENPPALPSTRSRSTLRTTKEGRSKSVMRDAAPKTPPARSKSVSREPTAHVPVYRQLAPIELPAVSAAKKQSTTEQDVYAFDSPGLLGQLPESDTEEQGGKRKRKAGGSTAKKKPRLGSSMSSRGKRVTPAKKTPLATAIFGTDMNRIRRVVKKIGGGPVKQPAEALQTVNLDPLPPVARSRPASPAASNYDPVNDHHDFADDDHQPMDIEEPEVVQPTIIPPSPPRPQPQVQQPNKINPLIERVLQQPPAVGSPDRTQPPNVTLSFSPLGASSPWRVQNENVLPRTFYFSRSKDLLPSYESDVVVRDENVRPKTPVADPVSPTKRPSPPAVVASITGAKADAMFRGIQKSYEQLKVTSEMSNKLITAMRKYKATVQNQSVAASMSASGELPEDERLIAKFREYEENMKKTYQKLKQWYERSQQQLKHSINTIEQVSAVPKTLAQRQVLDNFRRDSKAFLSMINDLESAMNDSNMENVSPRKVASADKPTFKDVVILTERNLANRNRSPLKTLEIANVPARFSPIKSPLVRSSFSAFASSKHSNKPAATAPTAIEIADTFAEPAPVVAPAPTEDPKKDLFGFEADDTEEGSDPVPSTATPVKITKKTLKERLESVRKMLPQRPPSRGATTTSVTRRETRMPKVIEGPSNSKLRSVQSVFASSTPMAKQKRAQTTQRGQLTEQDADLSAIADEPVAVPPPAEQPVAPSPPVALFDDVASTTLSAVNRTYSRIPRRNHKRKRNVYLADLGLSDDDEDEAEAEKERNAEESAPEEDEDDEVNKAKKKRRVAASKKKKKKNAVEETNEFKQFVSEFNSMCEEVDRYKLVIEKPAGGVRQRV